MLTSCESCGAYLSVDGRTHCGACAQDEIARLTAELAEARLRAAVCPPWQPIETAPKDRRILVAGPTPNGEVGVDIAKYDDDRFAKRPKPFWARENHWFGVAGSRLLPPTHWMEIPEVPS